MSKGFQLSSNPVANTYTNVATDNIITTHDKLENILIKFESSLSIKYKFVGSLSFSISLILSLLTSEFNDIYFKKEIWFSIFLVLSILSSLYCLYYFYKSFVYRRERQIEFVINRIKNISNEKESFWNKLDLSILNFMKNLNIPFV